MTPPPASSASSLVQEITALLAKLDEAPNRELAEEFKLHAPRLLRLLTAEYETLQREKDEWKQLYDETHARYDKAFARWEAAEARAEAAEGQLSELRQSDLSDEARQRLIAAAKRKAKGDLDCSCLGSKLIQAKGEGPDPVRPPISERSCCAPAPDRSGRSCDRPKGHDGEHWTYAGNTLTWIDRPNALASPVRDAEPTTLHRELAKRGIKPEPPAMSAEGTRE